METPHLFSLKPVIDSAATVCSDLRAYAEKYVFDVFVHCCRLDYVESKENVDAMRAVTEVCKKISSISQQFRDSKSGHWFILTSDQLYDQYLEFIPNLPSDTPKWTIQLSSQYYQALI